MQLIENKDILLSKQPEKNFTEYLCSPLHEEKPVRFSTRKKRKNEVLFDNVKTNFCFKNDCLLKYAYEDFHAFLKSCGIKESEDGKPINLLYEKSDNSEKFKIVVSKDKCDIYASDTRGIRRALIFIEDEMNRRSGAFLPLGETVKTPFIKTRISRCFFTPPSHASSAGTENELSSEIDYYPNEYLNRLVHDGINGLWIGTSFKKMLKSSIIKEFGKEQEIQVKKLNEIIEKCKYFGIDIFLFVSEPASSCYTEEMYNYPDMLGPTDAKFTDGFTLTCPSKQKVKKYIEEAVTSLFTLVPDLAGIINITVGESYTGCGSTYRLICPECKKTYGTLAKTLAATEKMFSDAMKKIAPDAKFISWTYAQRNWTVNDVIELCSVRDNAVIHMQNFEEWGRPVQLGKKRLAFDYWLSYAGPGGLMKLTAEENQKHGKTTFAKIQACSSHEISTVPYVPVPGILYDKYKYMYKKEISGVLQCWYFGNYPSMMNKAAYELSVIPFFKTKNEFLIHLAKTYFGNNYKPVVKAWKYFEKGYVNFPVNVAFEWMGPMQDSPCCPLHLLPVDWPMPGTWLKSEMSGGDRIGECLLNGHTIDEAITLTKFITKYWGKGLKYFNLIKDEDNNQNEQLINATAINLIFKSGHNILKFYKLRHLLGIREGNPIKLLNQMEKIVSEEIEISEKLIPITEKDKRIGYHSEANGYKIFPEKLKWRIKTLKLLLETEFKTVKNSINKGEIPLPFYYGLNEGSERYVIKEENKSELKQFVFGDGETDKDTALRAYEKNGLISIEIKVKGEYKSIKIHPEFNIMFPTIPLFIENNKLVIHPDPGYSVTPEDATKMIKKFSFTSTVTSDNEFTFTVSFKRKDMNIKKDEPFRVGLWRYGEKNSSLLQAKKYFENQLIRGEYSPDFYCFFVK